MKLVQRITLSANQAGIVFTGIPQDADDLLVVLSNRNTANVVDAYIEINGSTANITSRNLYGTGGGVGSGTYSSNGGYITTPSGATSGVYGSASFYFPNYKSSSVKVYSVDSVGENNSSTAFHGIVAGLFNSTAAITSIGFYMTGGGQMAAGSSATLYKITRASSGGVTVS